MDKKPQDTPSRHADKYIVRFPEGMRDRIAAAADASGRSMNAEIVQRLEWALSLMGKPTRVDSSHVQQPVGGALTWLITNEIKALADREHVSFDEMFARVVLAGLHKDAPQVVYLPIFPGATSADQDAVASAAAEVVRPDATVVLDNLWKARWAPDWMVEVMKEKCPEIIGQVADQKIMAVDPQFSEGSPQAEPPQRQLRDNGRKALVTATSGSGKTRSYEVPASGMDLGDIDLPEPPQPTEPPKRRLGTAKRRALEEAAARASKLVATDVAHDVDHPAPKPKKKI